MSGFIEIVPYPHPCKPPKLRRKDGYYVGTLWQCDCGTVWRVTWEHLGDRNWLKWNEPKRPNTTTTEMTTTVHPFTMWGGERA
jgi:hypothetical protein